MSDTSLLFNLLAIDRVSSVLGGVGSSFSKFAIGAGLAAAEAGTHFVHMAADFQTGITRLETGAGETHANLAVVSAGILDLAGKVGESTKDLNAGMYLIESAGFHGADGLNVLKLAAEGAKVGNADMATVADAVTTALNAYHLSASHAAEATNALIAAEGQGKTNLEALSGSLSTVAPIAAVAGVSLNEVLGAMATMTAQGTDAASAATYLKQTIGQLSNPSGKAAAEMQSLGLNATQVGLNLGKNGLASTLQMLTDAIQSKMGPAGTVLIEHLRKASANATDFQKVLADLPPAQQTYVGALATMVGGTKSMQAALELTGGNMEVFRHNTEVINEKVKAGGTTIEGWSQVQKTFNQHLAEAKGTAEALGIKIGNVLLPNMQHTLDATMATVGWFGKHKDVAQALAVTIGVVTAALTAYKIGVLAVSVAQKVSAVASAVWTAAQWALDAALWASGIPEIIIAVTALVAVIILIAVKTTWFQTAWRATWDFVKAVGLAIGHWFAGPFVDFFVGVWHGIVHGFDATLAFFRALPGRIVAGLVALPGLLWHLFVVVLEKIVYGVGFYLGTVVSFWIHLPGRIIDAVTTLGPMLWDWIVAAANGVINAVTSFYSTMINFWVRLPGEVIHAVSALGGLLWGWIVAAWNGVIGAMTSFYSTMINFWVRLPGEIWGYVSGLPAQLYHLGGDIIHGLINGIGDVASHLWDLAKDLAHQFIKGFKDALSISSPSKVMFELATTGIGAGLVGGLAATHAPVAAAGADMAAAAAGGAAATLPRGGTPAPSAGASRSGGGTLTLRMDGSPSGLEALFITWLQRQVRTGRLVITTS